MPSSSSSQRLEEGGGSCSNCGTELSSTGIGICARCLLDAPPKTAWEPVAAPSAQVLSERLARYEIGQELGRGALGAVYAARDKELGRDVAIKAITDNPNNPEFGERLQREALAMADLGHPHIVPIFDYGRAGDLHYLVMERMAGTLESEMGDLRKLPQSRALPMFGQLCQGLARAHANGIVHRDIKPANLLVDREGNVKVGDFGLAKGVVSDAVAEALTRSRMAMGTPQYMAPEQMEGARDVDRRADIYSAAAVLFEMLTGESAKDRDRSVARYESIPEAVRAPLDRALSAKPEHRYERIEAFAAAVSENDKRESEIPQKRATRWLAPLAGAALATLGMIVWQANGAKANAVPAESSIESLPLTAFEGSFDLGDWKVVGSYEFNDENHESDGKQGSFIIDPDQETRISDGKLVFSEVDNTAHVYLKRKEELWPAKGFALNLRYRAKAYPEAINSSEAILLDFSLRWDEGLFLECARWGEPNPRLLVGARQPLAPRGVVEPHLSEGEWHDVWVTLTDGYRVWIDGKPVYRDASGDRKTWERWGDRSALLKLGGFRGEVDYVRVYEGR